jgi:2-polyprenyl-3-methyl-5-hydroxy-6-metoxy-1,4-benzoquinol methylase
MNLYIKTKDYFLTKEKFDLLFDAENEMLITSPVPNNLEKYYQSDDYISHTDQSESLTDKLYVFIKNYNLKRKVRLLNCIFPEKGSLLDIGAGTGDFLVTAKENNWRVAGVEPNQKARRYAKTKGVNLAAALNLIPICSYDIITLWHVLEHMPNLNDQLAHITRLVKNGGYLILAVPNYKSYDAHYYKEHWAAYDVPRHLYHFTKSSIVKLLLPHGLELIDTKPMLFDSFYVSLLSEKYKTGKNRYLAAFFRGLVSNIKGWSSKEYSSHIYLLKKE